MDKIINGDELFHLPTDILEIFEIRSIVCSFIDLYTDKRNAFWQLKTLEQTDDYQTIECRLYRNIIDWTEISK